MDVFIMGPRDQPLAGFGRAARIVRIVLAGERVCNVKAAAGIRQRLEHAELLMPKKLE
jgi:hypothetical protein